MSMTREAILSRLNRSDAIRFTRPLETAVQVGTPNTGVTAVEYGDGFNRTTVLTVSKTAAVSLADNAAKGVGYLVYTFPAGAIVVNNAYMALTFTNAEHAANNTAEIGLGTVVASGAVSVLSGTATFENILTATASYDVGSVGLGLDVCDSTTGIGGLLIPAANAHTVYANIASTWANTAGAALDADLAGTIVLNWTFLA